MNQKIYLASNSSSRKILLDLAQIPFEVIAQDADESLVDRNQSLETVVKKIAKLKMEHAIIPHGTYDGQIGFVLTADTMNLTDNGQMIGKPKDRQEAKQMLRDSRAGNVTASGFCIRKMKWENNRWHVIDEIIDFSQALCVMDVPEEFLDLYLDTTPYDTLSGAIGVELAPQYCKKIEGSYTAVVGLPLYEVREALYKLGFYKK